MATAVQEKKPPTPTAPNASESEGGRFQVYKPGEGYATRLGTFVVSMLFVAFACHHWYYGWTLVRDFFDRFFKGIGLRALLDWTYNPDAAKVISMLGTVLLLLAGGYLCFHVIYIMSRSAEFLVKTDGELAKVTWPKITPWFKPETKVWGATYVVIVVLMILTVYIMIVDRIFISISGLLFY